MARERIDDDVDRVAREAARLMLDGNAADIDAAIRAAAEQLHLPLAASPSHFRVRRHAQGMRMQALGAEGYRAEVSRILDLAVEIMGAIEFALENAKTMLIGRAAKSLVDADASLWIRVYTDRPMHEVARVLVEAGCEEPVFETAESRFGRLDRLKFVEHGIPVIITRCPVALRRFADRDLFSEKRAIIRTINELRQDGQAK